MGHNKHCSSNLATFLQKNQNIANLKVKLDEINNKLNKIDEKLSSCERFGLQGMTDYLSLEYNKLNLERILLNLKLNQLEKEVLLFELEAAIRD